MKKTLSLLTKREAVLKAIGEYDKLGGQTFLKKYGFGKAKQYFLLYRGKQYDSKAIVGAAYGFQCGQPLGPGEFSGGKGRVSPKLKSLGFKVISVAIDDDSSSLPEEVPDSFPEGGKRKITINAYERNPQARLACIEHHGTCCVICDFDFGNTYGEEYDGFIHVHHKVPLSRLKRKRKVDPKNDLIPVCPNCHAVIHNRKKFLSEKHVKRLIKRQIQQ